MARELTVVHARSADVLAEFGGLEGAMPLLNSRDAHRCAQFRRAQDRADFVAARVLCRMLLAFVDPDQWRQADWLKDWWIQSCDICGGPHGAPVLLEDPGRAVSWSHSEGWVAVLTGHHAVGVDIEARSKGDAPPLPVSGDAAWTRFTRSEALVKSGAGTLDELLEACFDDLSLADRVRIRGSDYWLWDWIKSVDVSETLTISVASSQRVTPTFLSWERFHTDAQPFSTGR